ncbi:ABC transporter ATP-binding protein [Tuberibacillus calidus]|uniref:ABC transporter ATP-binding protein n=1 Tax=Tuberibacillus calidus TaxID=340097 RepID=UPI003CCC0CC1
MLMLVFKYLKPLRWTAAIALCFMLIELMVELMQPLLIAKVIDTGILKKDLGQILLWGSVMLGISLVSFIGSIIGSFYAAHTSQTFGYSLRVAVFKKIQSFSFANFNQFPTSSLITRMTNDITQIQNTVFTSLRIMLRAPLTVVIGTVMALLVDVKLGLFIAVVIPFLIAFLIWAMNKGGRMFRKVQEKLDFVNRVMRENLQAIRLIKALLRSDYENRRFEEAADDLKKRTVSTLRLMETTMPVLTLVMNLSIIGILWFGHGQIQAGTVKVGEVVAIINYATRITAAFSPLSWIIMAVSRAMASAGRISKVLAAEIDLKEAETTIASIPNFKGKVSFENVSFRYPGTEKLMLKNVSFTVNPGETVAVMGATGSGKSSLFQLIPRLYDVTEGGVFLDDTDVRHLTFAEIRRQIGYAPQEALLFTGSVRDNIAWGNPDATFEEIIEAAKNAQIHETIIHLPDGFDTILGQKGVNLSGGQKQRLSIARALVRRPKILLLDDSTSALDLKTEAKLLSALKNYQCTTFIITQKVTTAMEADRILLIDDGALLAEGTHGELLKATPLYQKIYESQLGKGVAS